MSPTWTDIHCHFDMLEDPPEEVLRKGEERGVTRMITIGTEPGDHDYVLTTAKKFFPRLACTIGIHPHHGAVWTEEIGATMGRVLADREVVAVGEIGLDYYYKQSPPEEQKLAFRRQLEMAESANLPVQIHTREAEDDTAEILSEYRGRVRGVIHCFTSSQELAKKCLDLGYNISFSGVVTFKNAASLRETCVYVPLDRMHVETDAPFLAPVPERGKKNMPAFVPHTAKVVADLKGISLEALSQATNENARRMFPKIVW